MLWRWRRRVTPPSRDRNGMGLGWRGELYEPGSTWSWAMHRFDGLDGVPREEGRCPTNGGTHVRVTPPSMAENRPSPWRGELYEPGSTGPRLGTDHLSLYPLTRQPCSDTLTRPASVACRLSMLGIADLRGGARLVLPVSCEERVRRSSKGKGVSVSDKTTGFRRSRRSARHRSRSSSEWGNAHHCRFR